MSDISTANLPTPQVFTISTLPSYEDAVKSSGEPPTYEQALTHQRVDTLGDSSGNSMPSISTDPNRNTRDHPHFRPNDCRRKFYRSLCWIVAGIVILLLGYIIYMGIWKNMNSDGKT